MWPLLEDSVFIFGVTFDPSRRYTCHLIGKAHHVTAVDFMEKFVEKNRRDHSHLGKADFLQADVTQLNFPQNRYKGWRTGNLNNSFVRYIVTSEYLQGNKVRWSKHKADFLLDSVEHIQSIFT